ncbi:Uracil-DNA glycosylase, partial [Fragariocoptes setiger]
QTLLKYTTKAHPTNVNVSNMGPSWARALQDEFNKSYFRDLEKFVTEQRAKCTVYPPVDQVYTWTLNHDIRGTRVVILGQDPYHGPRQAHGLSFSVSKGMRPPPSLINIYKELESDIPGFVAPNHGDLTGWSKQGVLLLNACLTVEAGKPNSHANKGWERFTDAIISWISKNSPNIVVFLLWGAYAGKKESLIARRHVVLKCAHPSPLSVHRGFFGCKHFSKANEALPSHHNSTIMDTQVEIGHQQASKENNGHVDRSHNNRCPITTHFALHNKSNTNGTSNNQMMITKQNDIMSLIMDSRAQLTDNDVRLAKRRVFGFLSIKLSIGFALCRLASMAVNHHYNDHCFAVGHLVPMDSSTPLGNAHLLNGDHQVYHIDNVGPGHGFMVELYLAIMFDHVLNTVNSTVITNFNTLQHVVYMLSPTPLIIGFPIIWHVALTFLKNL